ncbi:MAG TPA: hypothetical protein VG944_14155, partial [Fimbriimonas sp.]|nr:hypothetical protein [Fimbriimonas sp.]
MDQVLTVVQNTFAQTTDREALRAYYEHIWKEREAVPGYLGGMVWSDVEEPLSLLAIHRYRDVAAADLGAQVTAKASLMAERDRLPSEPTNVIRVRTTHDYGTLRESLDKAPYL